MAQYLRRSFTAIIGICAIIWACDVIPVYRAEAAITDTAQRVLAGDRFNPSQLRRLLDDAPSRPLQPSALSSAGIIRLLLLEDQRKTDSPRPAGADLVELQAVVNAALAKSPTNSFMWLTDFSLKRARGESAGGDLDLLRMSYRLAPNEGWIAVKRNPLALGMFPSLSSDLAEQALSEFAGLVRSGLYQDASNILAGPGWAVREQLLGKLVQLGEADRHEFAKALASKNLVGVTVPGVDERPSRPY